MKMAMFDANGFTNEPADAIGGEYSVCIHKHILIRSPDKRAMCVIRNCFLSENQQGPQQAVNRSLRTEEAWDHMGI